LATFGGSSAVCIYMYMWYTYVGGGQHYMSKTAVRLDKNYCWNTDKGLEICSLLLGTVNKWKCSTKTKNTK